MTYRYVADGRLESELDRIAVARLKQPRLWIALAIVTLAYGVGSLLVANAASLPSSLGRVVLVGVGVGLAMFALIALVIVAAFPLAKVANRRLVGRHFVRGSVTEVELADDALVIRRPTGVRTVPYRKVFRVRPFRSTFLRVERRGRLAAELLPLGLLPDETIEFIRARSRGTWPASTPFGEGQPARQMVIPPGWASHVAAVHTLEALKGREFRTRVALALVVSLALSAWAGSTWLAITAVFAILAVVVTYVRARRSMAISVPTGSVATTEFLEDRFVSRNAGGAREVRDHDIRAVDVRGDVVLLRLASQRGRFYIARALFPDEQLERLRDVIRSGRSGDQHA